jgi:hypothetical protein
MKKYFFGFVAITLAIAFSAFTKAPNFDTFKFKLKSGVDVTSATAVENEANWEVTALVCSPGTDQACTITVDASYTHLEGTAPNEIRVLNTSGTVANIISEAGSGSNRRIATAGASEYTFQNQVIE